MKANEGKKHCEDRSACTAFLFSLLQTIILLDKHKYIELTLLINLLFSLFGFNILFIIYLVYLFFVYYAIYYLLGFASSFFRSLWRR